MKIITSCPTRISLMGGGTDIKTYSSKFGGLVLGMAINIRQHIQIKEGLKDELLEKDNLNFFNIFKRELNLEDKYVIKHQFDVVTESGLGSSASLACALVASVYRLQGKSIDRLEIAQKAYDIEVNKIKMFGGLQDQLHASFGGANIFSFKNKGRLFLNVTEKVEKLIPYMLLFYTGKNRSSSKIQEGFKELSKEQIEQLNYIKYSVFEGMNLIERLDFNGFGKLLNKTWEYKKKSNKGVSNTEIDQIYDRGLKLGAWGGKLCGSGGGGHMLFIVDPNKQEQFKKQIGLKWIDFSMDKNGLEMRVEE